MQRLWLILAVLTLARTTMGFQFQSVAAVGPLLTSDSIITHTQLGALIGIYLLPGALFAIPGGWLGKRFGDKRVVLTGLAMMTLGGAIVSLASWLIIPALPLGAWFAERIGRPVSTMVVTFLAIAILTWMIPITSFYLVTFAAIGIIFGPAGGLIMALPAQILKKQNRAIGMGIFFTIYYLGMGVFTAIAGYARDVTGNPAAPLILAGVAILITVLMLIGFRMVQIRQVISSAATQ